MRRHFLKKFVSAAEQAAESEDLMEFFNSAVDTLQTIVVGLGGALLIKLQLLFPYFVSFVLQLKAVNNPLLPNQA